MIDEKKLIEEIADFKRSQKSKNCDYLTGYISALSVIEGMIAEQQKVGGWIPCKDELPKTDGEYLVTIVNTEKPTTLYFSCNTNEWFDDNFDLYKVLAWQELPEPYKGE